MVEPDRSIVGGVARQPRRYEGPFTFNKHLYPGVVGDMNAEEALFAYTLDCHAKVEVWVRNVERVRGSFWLPTSTDRFYPDFLAKAADGRWCVFEYKGADRLASDDTREKQQIGAVYADRSQGACVFALVGKEDFHRTLDTLLPA